jgi:orotate phosphoribosyltransferase
MAKEASAFETGLARNELRQLIKERSFSTGAISLASGKASNFYFDMKPTMFHPRGAALLCDLILDRIKDIGCVDYLGGMALGAVPLLSPLSMRAQERGRYLPGFFVRKEVKNHGTMRLVEGVADGELKGKRVLILDDVTTTGGSAFMAVQAAQAAGAEVVQILSVVDREEGAAEFFRDKNIPFDWLFAATEFR